MQGAVGFWYPFNCKFTKESFSEKIPEMFKRGAARHIIATSSAGAVCLAAIGSVMIIARQRRVYA